MNRNAKNTIKDILADFVKKNGTESREDEWVESLKRDNAFDLSSPDWQDEMDILGYQVPCPRCGKPMKANDLIGLLYCPDCGYSIADSDYPRDGMPSADEL